MHAGTLHLPMQSSLTVGTFPAAPVMYGSVTSSSVIHPPSHAGAFQFPNPSANTTASTAYIATTTPHGPPLTISFWAMTPLAFNSSVIGLRSNTTTAKAMQIKLWKDGSVLAQTSWTGTGTLWSSVIQSAASAVRAYVWCHIAYTISWNNIVMLYVNGNLVASGALSASFGGYDTLIVGGGVDGTSGFDGYVADVRM